MKRILIVMFTAIVAMSICSAASFQTTTNESFNASERLILQFYLDNRIEPHFIFSDVADIKGSDFEDPHNKPGLDWITLSTVRNGRLYNDGNLYVHWLVEPYIPMDKLTIEMPTPLKLSDQDELDWYAMVDDGYLIGGKDGYGASNAVTLYDRDHEAKVKYDINSVQLKLWTDDITGKKAGNYLGSLVLRVIGEC